VAGTRWIDGITAQLHRALGNQQSNEGNAGAAAAVGGGGGC
jgi:hypothetical protein